MSEPAVETASPSVPVRILLAEDDVLTRFSMAETLRDLGAMVVEAASADEAWQYLGAGGVVDLVFADHQMPGSMTGAQLALRMRQHYPRLNILLTSAHFDDPEWKEPVLRKPYDMAGTAADLIAQALLGRGGSRP